MGDYEMKRDLFYFLRLISNRQNWKFDKEYEPYGQTVYINQWIGDEDIETIADELLMKYEKEFEDVL